MKYLLMAAMFLSATTMAKAISHAYSIFNIKGASMNVLKYCFLALVTLPAEAVHEPVKIEFEQCGNAYEVCRVANTQSGMTEMLKRLSEYQIASKSNPLIRSYYQGPIARGKLPKVALTACTRKLLVMLNAMVRDNQSWNANNA